MPSLPLVSILIPAYNPRYFQEALHSAQEQTYPNIEIIVCDDSADERIGEIATAPWKRPVHYEKNPVRLQGRGNFNKCISLAQGEYIKFLNDDDRLTRDCIAKLLAPLIQFPELSLATSKRRRIDATGDPLPDSESTLTPVTEDSRLRGPSVCRAILTSMTNFIGEPSTALVRRSALPPPGTDVMSYQGVPIRYLADVAMWFNALGQGDAVYLTEALSDFRVHGEQHQQTEDAGAMVLPNYRLLCRLGVQQGLIDAETAEELENRPRMIPGWATLQFKPLEQTTRDWQEAMLYFGPERIPLGATTARLDDLEHIGNELGVSDSFLFQEQFAQIAPSPSTVLHSSRSTRKCMLLWNQLLVDQDGLARPCPRRAPTRNIYVTSLERELQLARFQLLIGRPGGECRDCDLCPHVPLQNFVEHNFRGRHNLLQASRDRLTIAELDGVKENPTQILVVGHSAGRAGGEFVALALVRSLAEDFGCQVTLVLARGGALADEFRRYARVFVIGEDLLGTEATRELFLRLRLVEGFRHAICNTVVTGRYAAWLKAFGYQVTHLVHELSTNIEFLPDEDRHGVCDSPDTLVFPVGFVRNSFLDRYTPRSGNLVLHPQGIEPDFERPADRQTIRNRLREKLALPADARLVIGAGSGELRKGPDLFLQVARNVLAKTADLKTHFVWLGELEASLSAWIRHDARTLGLERNFHMAGLQSDLTDYYLGTDIFLMTSREDPLPNVVIESMYAGLPVIAFAEGGGTPELLEEGCGVVVPYLDTDAMAAATRHLLNDAEAALSIGRLAARRIETGFRREDYTSFLLSRFTAPVHRVTLVLPGQDAAQLSQQLERLSTSFDKIAWRPDALLLISPEAAPFALPPALSQIRTTHLALPRETPSAELLSQAAAQADTELLWFVDLALEQITGDLPTLITAFDSPQVVAAFGPGHNPAQPEALAPIPLALLGLNERHWLKAHWLDEASAAPLARSTPVLALASGLLRRAAVKALLASQSFKGKKPNPLWFWPLLVELGKLGTLAWTPRPTVAPHEQALPGSGGEAPAWWEHWCQAQDAAAQRLPAASRQEQDQDRRQLRDALGLSIAATGKQKSGTQAPSSQSPQLAALSPKDELNRYNQAANQLERGRLEKAHALLLDLAQRGSTLWQVYFDLGRIAFEQEQTSQAITHFRQAASLEFSSTNALRNLVAIYTMNQEYGAALAAVGLILRREEDPDLLGHLHAIVTEAGVSLDSLDWASPQLKQQHQEEQQTLKALEQQLGEAEHRISSLEKQLLLAQAGLPQSQPNSQPQAAPLPLTRRP